MRSKTGIVVSAKNDKTIIVLVHTKKMHPILKKTYRTSKKFHAHDEKNKCQEGDEVIILETKPISKNKCWTISQILKRDGVEFNQEQTETEIK